MHLLAALTPGASMWPIAVLAISVVFIVILISVLRVHAFLALIFAALLAGMMAEQLPGARPRNAPAQAASLKPGEKVPKSHWLRAVELTTEEFGKTAGAIGLVIGFASIISMCLLESGAADKVVRRFLIFFGEKHAGVAILISTYILSIPIFFDTMFMLMIPLATTLCLRTGKDYLLYVMAICCAGVLTHSLAVPHPGPLAMAESLKLDVGLTILAGLLAGIIPLTGGWFVAKWLNRRRQIPVRLAAGVQLEDLRRIANKPENELPSFLASITPILLPIFLITLASFAETLNRSYETTSSAKQAVEALGGRERFGAFLRFIEFIGNKNIALLIATIISMRLLARQRGFSFRKIEELIGPPLLTAGVIILITSAGGAFGLMLKNAGVGDAIKAVAEGRNINLIFLSYMVAFVLRIAQGSATVAMLTAAAMVAPMIDPALAGAALLPYHPIYIFLAIGFGAFACSWMNDSGFWVVSKLGGLTETETLSSWTVLLTFTSIFGLVTTLLFSVILPLK